MSTVNPQQPPLPGTEPATRFTRRLSNADYAKLLAHIRTLRERIARERMTVAQVTRLVNTIEPTLAVTESNVNNVLRFLGLRGSTATVPPPVAPPPVPAAPPTTPAAPQLPTAPVVPPGASYAEAILLHTDIIGAGLIAAVARRCDLQVQLMAAVARITALENEVKAMREIMGTAREATTTA